MNIFLLKRQTMIMNLYNQILHPALKTKMEKDWTDLKNGKPDQLIAVDFTATWCGPCRMIGPKFLAMEKEFPSVFFCKIDVDENNEAAEEEEVSAMPTFKFFRNGIKVDELVGANENELRAKLEKNK